MTAGSYHYTFDIPNTVLHLDPDLCQYLLDNFVNFACRDMYMCATLMKSCDKGFDFVSLHLIALSNSWGRYDPKTERHIESDVMSLLKVLMKGFMSSSYTKEFNFKLLHGILPCNKNLMKWKVRFNSVCDVCDETQTIVHLLYDCYYVKPLWKVIDNVCKTKVTFKQILGL